jgi:FKBP-type peptidyl-prolyl cis-trans isomerase
MIRIIARSLTAALILTTIGGCLGSAEVLTTNPSDPATETFAPSLNVDLSTMTETVAGLYIKDLTEGTGDPVVKGDRIGVIYSGYLTNGSLFDSNVGELQLFYVTIGTGAVIAGWDLGIPGMKLGGKRQLVFSSELGYGGFAQGSIPPNSTLVFTIELRKIN